MEILVNGECLDLPKDVTLPIERTNPIFNEVGSQSMPVTLPLSSKNKRMLGHPDVLFSATDPNANVRFTVVNSGAFSESGALNIGEVSPAEGITVNIGFDNSTAYSRWASTPLNELPNLPRYNPMPVDGLRPVEALLGELDEIRQSCDSQSCDFAVFPVALSCESHNEDGKTHTYWEILNVSDSTAGLKQPTSVMRVMDGKAVRVNIPEGYMVSPFLRVWRILELVFADMNCEIIHNPFKEDLELSRLVILNNCADSVCRGYIQYSDLMPDCSVQEFMNALWVRFGLVYSIDYNTGTVALELLKDVIKKAPEGDLSAYITGDMKISYLPAQYIKLTAKSSLPGAAPVTERFEDFARGLNVDDIKMGGCVRNWKWKQGGENTPRWDGDLGYGYYDDDYDPDRDRDDYWDDRGDDHDDDYRDDRDWENSPSAPLLPQATPAQLTASTLAYEFVTGLWYKLDVLNNITEEASTSFFDWNPKPRGLDAMELASPDEWVPIVRVRSLDGAGYWFNDYAPYYSVGPRHMHTYVRQADAKDTKETNTPLALMLAYSFGGSTCGRISPETSEGIRVTLSDGTRPTLSLLFQFSDGLFSRFWREYDELLRHGARTVEAKLVRRCNSDALSWQPFKPVLLDSVPCLFDRCSYNLPVGRHITQTVTMRPLLPLGNYDIDREQNIPSFGVATRTVEWTLLSSDYGEGLLTDALITEVCNDWIESIEYIPHYHDGHNWFVLPEGFKYIGMNPYGATWESDIQSSVPEWAGVKLTRQYTAVVDFEVYECYRSTYDDGEECLIYASAPIAHCRHLVQYSVKLISAVVPE